MILAGSALLLYVLASYPAKIVEQYQKIKAIGPFWGYLYLGGIAIGISLLVGALCLILFMLWSNSRRERKRAERNAKEILKMAPKEKEKAIASYIEEAKELAHASQEFQELKRAIESAAERLEQKKRDEHLEIAAFGTISSGKSSLLNMLAGKEVFESDVQGGTTLKVSSIEWPGTGKVSLVDTPGLAEISGGKRGFDARDAAKKADIILFVIDGPLKDFEFRTIRDLQIMGKRILVCLNKRDWYSKEDLSVLLQRIRDQLKGLVRPEDIVAIQSEPVVRHRERIRADGTAFQEHLVAEADIDPLVTRLTAIIQDEAKDILLNNLLLQSRGLKTDTLQRIKIAMDESAVKKINEYTWKAAAAAAVSPTPFIDAAAGLALSIKMILELASIYRRNMDLDTAKELLSQLMKSLGASLGATSLSPALSQLVASSLKGVPGLGTLAGGALQGVTQALVTQWIGRVMKEYFSKSREETATALDEMARRHWEKMTSRSELVNLAMTGMKYISEAKGD